MPKEVVVVALASVVGGRLLVARKRGLAPYILPGGKPDGSEDDLTTLAREVREELGCGVADAQFVGTFADASADDPNITVVVRLYSGSLVGAANPAAEIEELAWVDLDGQSGFPLAPSLTNHILPFLAHREVPEGVS